MSKTIKEATKLYFTHYSCVVIILFNTSLNESVFSTYSFGKLDLFFLSAHFVFSHCSELIIFINELIFKNFCNICIIIIYIVGVRYYVFLFSFITSRLNNLWELTRHKNLITALIKKHASRKLLSFKNSIYKEKWGMFT